MSPLMSVLMLPMVFGQGRRYHEWQLVSLALSTCMAIVWLAAPIALWQAFGAYWMLPWLIPSGALICLLGLSRGMAGGG